MHQATQILRMRALLYSKSQKARVEDSMTCISHSCPGGYSRALLSNGVAKAENLAELKKALALSALWALGQRVYCPLASEIVLGTLASSLHLSCTAFDVSSPIITLW